MTPIRLHCVVEGQTEEDFVRRILAPDLAGHGVFADVHRITTGRRHGKTSRGGFSRYEHLANDLALWMKQDQGSDSWFTTMVDLYAIPTDFPGFADLPATVRGSDRAARLEQALGENIERRLPSLPVARRFIPYIQVHEFEALLFSDPASFEKAFPDNEALVKKVGDIAKRFLNPEDIDDAPSTAPSKRIITLAPDYEKVVAGLLIAQRIGLEAMTRSCPHFGAWVERLRHLGARGIAA